MQVQKIETVHTRAHETVLNNLQTNNPNTIIQGSYDHVRDVWIFVLTVDHQED